jgi:MarR family transcriptional regulator, organic hydroperoxide resistance regulator
MDSRGTGQSDNTAHLISAVRRAVNGFLIDSLKAHDISGLAPSHGDIIATLLRNDLMTMTDLAHHIHRDRSTVTTLVQKLADRGYIAFKENPDDARSRLVYLTDMGRSLNEIFMEISDQLAETLWHGIDDEDRSICRGTLRNIVANFEAATADRKG